MMKDLIWKSANSVRNQFTHI